MPQIAEDLIGRPIGMYDADDPQTDLNIIHAVDITDVCGGNPKERKLLKFTRPKRGVLVQLIECYEGQTDMGSSVSYQVTDLGLERTDLLGVFHRFAGCFGISSERLLELVREHAPT